MIRWLRRPDRDQTLTAKRRIWRDRDGRYQVQELTSLYGLPYRVLAIAWVGQGWKIISQHRAKGPAMKACENHHAKQ